MFEQVFPNILAYVYQSSINNGIMRYAYFVNKRKTIGPCVLFPFPLCGRWQGLSIRARIPVADMGNVTNTWQQLRVWSHQFAVVVIWPGVKKSRVSSLSITSKLLVRPILRRLSGTYEGLTGENQTGRGRIDYVSRLRRMSKSRYICRSTLPAFLGIKTTFDSVDRTLVALPLNEIGGGETRSPFQFLSSNIWGRVCAYNTRLTEFHVRSDAPQGCSLQHLFNFLANDFRVHPIVPKNLL